MHRGTNHSMTSGLSSVRAIVEGRLGLFEHHFEPTDPSASSGGCKDHAAALPELPAARWRREMGPEVDYTPSPSVPRFACRTIISKVYNPRLARISLTSEHARCLRPDQFFLHRTAGIHLPDWWRDQYSAPAH